MPALLHHSPAAAGGRRVFLATPTYGPVPALYAYCLFKSHLALVRAGYEVELGLLTGDCHVDDARNRLVRDFLASECQDMVFIDADMGWDEQDLIRLLSYDRDLVGGTYPMKQMDEDYPVRPFRGELWSDSDGLIEVEGIPTGFMRIRKPLLRKLADEARQYAVRGSDDQLPAPLIFERGLTSDNDFYTRVSGDYNFCRKWRALGGEVYLDPELYLEHAGEKVWSGCYGSYLRRKNGLALKRALDRIRNKTEDAFSLRELITDWNNGQWTAGIELLSACAQVARQVKGPILETGSGLTTLVLAAANPDIEIWSLESEPEWMRKVCSMAFSLGLNNVRVVCAPLDDTGWYMNKAANQVPWKDIVAVVCDGPDRKHESRDALFGRMEFNGCNPKCVLVDDIVDADEVFQQWCAMNNYSYEVKGQLRPFGLAKRAA